MTRHLLLACALLLAVIGGAGGSDWAILTPIPHLLARAWLTAAACSPIQPHS